MTMTTTETTDYQTARKVIVLLEAQGIRASWEFPGYLRVRVPGGKADLAYGTVNGDWSGHYESDASGKHVEGWNPQTLPIDASPERVATVIVDGVATSKRAAMSYAAALVVETHRSVPDPRRRPTFSYVEPCKGYAMLDGPQRGLIFHASDDPSLGATVQAVYHPDDQYARTYTPPPPTLDQLRERASDEIDALVDALYNAAGYDPETACPKKGNVKGDLEGIGPEEVSTILSSVASFLACIASDDINHMPAFAVATLSGLVNGLGHDLDLVTETRAVSDYATALAAKENK